MDTGNADGQLQALHDCGPCKHSDATHAGEDAQCAVRQFSRHLRSHIRSAFQQIVTASYAIADGDAFESTVARSLIEEVSAILALPTDIALHTAPACPFATECPGILDYLKRTEWRELCFEIHRLLAEETRARPTSREDPQLNALLDLSYHPLGAVMFSVFASETSIEAFRACLTAIGFTHDPQLPMNVTELEITVGRLSNVRRAEGVCAFKPQFLNTIASLSLAGRGVAFSVAAHAAGSSVHFCGAEKDLLGVFLAIVESEACPDAPFADEWTELMDALTVWRGNKWLLHDYTGSKGEISYHHG